MTLKKPWALYTLILLFLVALGLSGIRSFQSVPTQTSALPTWKTGDSVGVVVINGPISYNYSSTSFYSQTVDHLIKNLAQLRNNPAIKSLVVRTNVQVCLDPSTNRRSLYICMQII